MPAAVLRMDLPVTMSDGTILSTDVWTPSGEGPWTTLLQRLPYDKGSSVMVQGAMGLEIRRALDRGYAVVIQDTRGRYASAGLFAPFEHEAADGAETIAWIREQDFSTGQVFMYGASYVGVTQIAAASQSPPGLAAIAPQLTSGDLHSPWTYCGGALQLGFVLLWVIEGLAPPDLDRRLEALSPAKAQLAREFLEIAMRNPNALFRLTPIFDEALSLLAPYATAWMSHPRDDQFWAPISYLQGAVDAGLPALHIAGWNDIFVEGSLATYTAMREGPNAYASENQRLIVGPWSHGNMTDWQGDEWLGYAASGGGAADLTEAHLDFFDAVREGAVASSPRVRYFRSGSNTWHAAQDWPLATARPLELFLGDGALDSALGSESIDSYVSDPRHPVPTAGGATFLPGLAGARNSGPQPQTAIESRLDVVVYSSPQLDSDLDVTGTVEFVLWASSDAIDCDFTVRLCDVDEAGRSVGIVDSIQRARYRTPAAAFLTPGELVEYRIQVGSTAHLFRGGHRLRVQIASSNFPRFDRNPQTGADPTTCREDDFALAHQNIHRGTAHPSRLILPVVQGT